MPDVVAVDRLEILVLVDNATDGLSSNPDNVTAEWSGLLGSGRLRVMSGQHICRAHHGLSLLVTVHVGGATRTVLFDAGPEGTTFVRNVGILGADLGSVEAVVLSHGHWDHAGGLLAAIDGVATSRAGRKLPCYMHPGMFGRRGSQRSNGEFYEYEPVPEPAELSKAGATVVNTREPQLLGDGAFYVSGEVPRVTEYEVGLPGHVRLGADGRSWEPDPLIMDERFIAVHVRRKGLVVLSACSHAGIVNVVTHAREVFSPVPLYGVMGGMHLSGVTEKIIPSTVADLKRFGPRLLAPAHCTGWRAVAAMAKTFGDELVPSAVGKRYVI